jgi:protoporphyrinogen oxidase
MIFIYLLLEQDRFSEYDAHYFPEPEIAITRISEPKNYSVAQIPANKTVLCAELPCSMDGQEWNMSDKELGGLVCRCLESSDIPLKAPVKEIITKRISHAYPVYRKGYELYLDQIDQWFRQIENLLTFGRQGLFVHDNIHHALYMAYAAVKCLNENGYFDHNRWRSFRHEFNTHVVVD